MEATSVELRATLDREWLEEAVRSDPVSHAYAAWDLARFPDRVRFVSAVEGGHTIGYLLHWLGHPSGIVVHWVGGENAAPALAAALPPRPFVAIVPPAVRDIVLRARGPGREFGVRLLTRGTATEGAATPDSSRVRRLSRADATALTDWVERQDAPELRGYRGRDPEAEPTWAAFDHGRLVGVARAAVRLPSVWIVSGVYVAPSARRQGWGRALVSAVAAAAEEAGAVAALFAREDRAPALGMYEGLGFRPIGRRLWLDLGTGLSP